ncbi:MAG: glycosyltransferase family 4 protein [Leptolyngbya sp. SIO1D8]|nr:glycosyltransferase family 4 protein [Leptolyngbya sp. SIO1D8]
MKILMVHNEYQIRGGEDESCELERRLLQNMGHDVETYKEHNDRIQTLGTINTASKTIWSTESYKTVHHRLKQAHYNIVHVQNFFPLISPSVYYAAKAEGVPVIQTLRNYRLLCPNGLFFRDGKICEDCLGKPIPYPGVIHGCYRGSPAASGITAAMLTVHRALQTWTKMVNIYISLTNFARNKFIQGGLPAEKIVVKPNFVDPDPGVGQGQGAYALYVGRLSPEKGLDTLLSAWKLLKTPVPLKIIGDGPLAPEMQQAAAQFPHIEWLGRKPMADVHNLMGEAMFLIFPSKWYETFGRVAVEAFAKGTPVVAANVGAIAELVQDDYTGRLFEPDNSQDLASQIDWLLARPAQLAAMRKAARAEFETKFTAKANYQRLIEIYDLAGSHS